MTASTSWNHAFSELRIIDCDSLTKISPRSVDRRVRSRWRTVSRIHKNGGRQDRLVPGRRVVGQHRWQHDGTGNEKILGSHVSQPFETHRQRRGRSRRGWPCGQDRDLVLQVLYPNGIGFVLNDVFAIEDNCLRTLVLTVTPTLVDVQAESGGRLFPRACFRSGTWT